ncbi:MAG: glutamine-hydrolyzing GMP synthase, partial [Candidatus Nanopelagicaceae bacterium]
MLNSRSNHVLVIDFGAQYAQLIARRIRQAGVYSEIVPSNMSVDEIRARNPRAIVLSGGPSSVYAEGAPQIDRTIFDSGIPIFGICYGFQAMAQALGGAVAKTGNSEFGRTKFTADRNSKLFAGFESSFDVWMSHGDSVIEPPDGFQTIGHTNGTPVAAFENSDGTLAGVQFHPEVIHSENGQA